MVAKIVRDKMHRESLLYRLLKKEELPLYTGSDFLIDTDKYGAKWIYVSASQLKGEM